MKRLLKYSMILAGLCAGLQAGPLLTLSPVGGALSGSPGQTVGWGFTLENSGSSDYLLVTIAEYVTSIPSGTFTDFVSASNIVVGATPESASITQAFDLVLNTGIGSYLIDAGTPVGYSSTGFIRLTYDLYSISPNDPGFDPGLQGVLLSGGNVITADASILVSAAPQPQDAPEPSTWLLMGCGLIAIAAGRRRKSATT